MLRPIAAIALAAIAAAADPAELNFGIIATESAAALKQNFTPLAADLAKDVGMPVKLFVASDYAGVIEAMRFNKVQLAWFGNKSAIDAVDRGNGEVFAQIVDKDGNPGYWSLVIVHKDSPINSLQDLFAHAKEMTFSMGDPQSTSGTLVPGYFVFAKNGVDPYKAFKSCRNGNHESNALAVANKVVDASTFNTEAQFRLQQTNPEKAAQIKVIWKSGLIASDPLVMRKDLSQGLKDRIQAFFVNYGRSAAQREAIAALKWSGFLASNDDQLLPYRHLSALKEKGKLQNDTQISADAKAAKIAELDRTIAELEVKMAAVAKAKPAN